MSLGLAELQPQKFVLLIGVKGLLFSPEKEN
jgi:hypothetical protein